MRFSFTHSHAFPGGLVIVKAGELSGPTGTVEFSDGIAAEAEWRSDGEDLILEIWAYRTAKGTAIGPHHWRIVRDEDATWHTKREP